MTEEVAVQEDDAAFAAGFAEARGDEPPAQEEAKPEAEAEQEQEPEGEEQSEPEGEPEPEQEEEASEPVVAGLTEEQLTSMLAKLPKVDQLESMTSAEIRKVYGKIGELQQKLNALGESGGNVRLTADAMKRLSANYPELAQDLVEDLSEALQGVGGGSQPVDIEPIVEQRVKAAEEELNRKWEMRWLTTQHRDWEQVAASDEFKVWVQTLPEEDQQTLDTTWDAVYISDKLTEYKEWRNTRQAATQNRQQRLQQAVTPQGKPQQNAPALTDDDAFLAGWKAARS